MMRKISMNVQFPPPYDNLRLRQHLEAIHFDGKRHLSTSIGS
jgi:hypothetical protein